MLFIEHEFKDFLPLMGKEYFFPDLPLGGRMNLPYEAEVFDDDDEDEEKRDNYYASKIDCYPPQRIVVEYADEIGNNITNIDSSNFDVVSFLSTEKRDYLIRNDTHGSGEYKQVKVLNLRDKSWVMICCFSCPVFSHANNSLILRAVSNVCSELYESYGGSFEMVLVFKMMGGFLADESAFRHQLSGFPSSCLVVPFWDSHSSDLICYSLGLDGAPKGLFVRVDERKVIWRNKGLSFFKQYGIDAFPFTDDVQRKLSLNERRPWNSRSLEDLLCCSSILYKNLGSSGGFETTSIEQLKEKLVGVYLCKNGQFIPKLHEIYECCKATNKPLEIVVVYFPFSSRNSDPQLFQMLINRALEKRKISWWILPFKNWVSLKLSRLCGLLEERLIIVGKGFVDPHSAYVIRHFGMPAYPFSRKLMFEKEAERISKVTLASLLVYGDRDYVLRKDFGGEHKVPVASLGGKNIFIFVDYDRGRFNKTVSGPLIDYYVDIKAKDPEFEVVYVGPCAASVSTEIPWLVCPYDIEHMHVFPKEIFLKGTVRTTIVAIKKDGMVGSIQAHKHLSSRGVQAIPFDGSGLKREVMDELQFKYYQLELGDM